MQDKKVERVTHTLPPVFDARSRILVLGTMPSPKSRETGFYYGHPQNRFWRVMACVLSEDEAQTNGDKASLLLRHGVALWDVLRSCDIRGASDGSIQNPVANDMGRILRAAPVRAIFTTGTAATRLYQKYCFANTHRSAIYLPSTSPANCAHYPFERLVEAYRVILEYL